MPRLSLTKKSVILYARQKPKEKSLSWAVLRHPPLYNITIPFQGLMLFVSCTICIELIFFTYQDCWHELKKFWVPPLLFKLHTFKFKISLTCVSSVLLSHLHRYGQFSSLMSSWFCYSMPCRRANAPNSVIPFSCSISKHSLFLRLTTTEMVREYPG